MMNKLSFAAAAALVLAAAPALAQIKTDGQMRGTAGLAIAATSGNTSSASALGTLDLVKATTADKFTLGGMINYARNKEAGVNKTTSNKWAAFGQYDWNLTQQLFAFGRVGLEGDKLVDLDLRTAVAGGVGYHLVNTKTAVVDVFGGLAYTTDKYGTVQTIAGDTGTRFSRASIYLGESGEYKLSDSTSFKQRLDLFPGISGDKALLAKFTAGLNVAMSSTMALNVGLIHNYNSKPAAGVKKGDTAFFTGINMKLGAL